MSALAKLSLALYTALWVAAPVRSETYIWQDAAGVTHLTDDPEGVPPGARHTAGRGLDALRAAWGPDFIGPPVRAPRGGGGSDGDRVLRLLRGAVEDLGRSETARAGATLRSVLRLEPGRPEAHWYLALLDRQRGRYQSAERHLRAFLSRAGGDLAVWRSEARRQLADLADERRLADESQHSGSLRLLVRDSPGFRVQIDADLAAARPDYADAVMRDLADARAMVSERLGLMPREPLGVVFYAGAAYQRRHGHRFSFRTVGFFDGRIHVSSPAHPKGELRARLFHEYTHAVYRDRTGGDRPYWLNEGLAELVERRARGHPTATRSERASLWSRVESGAWLPLRRLAPSFSGLDDADARAAYLESILAAAWIEAHTDRDARSRLLERLGAGYSIDQALHEVAGLDTDALDVELQRALRAEFPGS